ncbi:MAG: amidohydrolase family protein, partial [Xanthobacteraceae bacterium]
MDMPRSEVRNLRFDEFSVEKHLEHAAQQARARNYQDFLIVDVDSHHYENESHKEVFEYIDSPVIRRSALDSMARAGRSAMLNTQVGYQDLDGRITRAQLRKLEKTSGETHRDIITTKRWMDAMGVDYACLFPTPMLFLGLHPQVEIEAALSQAYNRWLCERILAAEPRLVSMLYLPLNDPEAAYRTVQEFGDKKGVTGFMVTSPRYKPVHDNVYMKTYALLEEMGKPIAFHAAYSWEDRALGMTNRFISVHALGFMWFNMIHMANWVV